MRAMESTRRKLYASEEKCSWSQNAPEVMTLSEASSSEARSPEDERLKVSKVVQWI